MGEYSATDRHADKAIVRVVAATASVYGASFMLISFEQSSDIPLQGLLETSNTTDKQYLITVIPNEQTKKTF